MDNSGEERYGFNTSNIFWEANGNLSHWERRHRNFAVGPLFITVIKAKRGSTEMPTAKRCLQQFDELWEGGNRLFEVPLAKSVMRSIDLSTNYV